MKPRLKSKTNWFAIALGAFGAVLEYMPALKGELFGYYGLIFIGVAAVVGILREVTKEPVG